MENIAWIFFRALLRAFLQWIWAAIQTLSWAKCALAQMYGVSIKTLNKWVRYFCPEIRFKAWKSWKQISLRHALIIFDRLGCPRESRVMSKAEMVEVFETNLKTLKMEVLKLFRKWNIQREAYEKLNIFPPAVVCKITQTLN